MGILTQEQLSSNLGEATKNFMFIGLFLTILPVLSGFVFRSRNELSLFKTLVASIGILVIGFLMNTTIWGLDSNYSWNVLQLVAISLLLISVLRMFFDYKTLSIISFVIVFFSGGLRDFVFEKIGMGPFTALFFGDDNIYNVIWPIFPWFGMILFGFCFANYYIESKNKTKFLNYSLYTGAVFILIGIITGGINPELTVGYVFRSSLMETSLLWLVSTIGLFLVLFYIGNKFFSKVKFSKYGIVNSFSSSIIFVYFTQMFLSVVFTLVAKGVINRTQVDSYDKYLYFITPVVIINILICWAVGAFFIKLLQNKNIVISFKKVN